MFLSIIGRPRKNPESSSPASCQSKPPGHLTFFVNDFSLTISKTKEDVSLKLLNPLHDFLTKYAVKGGVSTEVGPRAHNLHYQSSFTMRYPRDNVHKKKLTKMIKDEVIKETLGSYKGYKVFVKPFSSRQDFTAMLGYITKDEGQPHYQLRTHNITRVELDSGRREHAAMLTSFDDEKKIINIKNFFNECFKFNKRCLFPCIVPIDYVVMYMIQSGNYILTPDFISQYRKFDLEDASALWEMTHNPPGTDIEEVRRIIFDGRSYERGRKRRYYVAGLAATVVGIPRDFEENFSSSFASFNTPEAMNNNIETPDSGSIIGEEEVAEDTKSCSYEIYRKRDDDICLASRLVHHMRDNNVQNKNRKGATMNDDEDVIPITPEPGKPAFKSPTGMYVCPPTLMEMMNIVHAIRSQVTFGLTKVAEESAPLLTAAGSSLKSSSVPIVSPPEPSAKLSSNYRMFCH